MKSIIALKLVIVILVLALCLVLNLSTACAADNRVDMIIGTYHFDRDFGFNNFNPGIAISHQMTDKWGVGIARYRNSESGLPGLPEQSYSNMMGVEYTTKISKSFDLRVSAGVVTGYYAGDRPYLIPTFVFKKTVNLTLIPLVFGGGINLSATIFRF
jgi:hypothetical protein